MYFVDTNIFLYFIFPKVDPEKHRKVYVLFEKATSGKIYLWTTEWVIAELIWFLSRKKYKWPEVQKSILEDLFITKGLEVRGQDWLEPVIKKSRKITDFVDLVNLKILKDEKIKNIYSFDRGFDKYKNFKRLEP